MSDYTPTATAVNPLSPRMISASKPISALQRSNGNGRLAVRLSQAWTRATPAERAEFGRAIGVNVVWDDAVAPNLA